MIKIYFELFFIFILINQCLPKINEEINIENNLRSLKPTPILDSKTKNADSLKLHSKLLQTLYSDSFSNNYYYTTLYIGPNKIKQRYLIDTTNAILSSPCGSCEDCGKHKKNYYDHSNKKAYTMVFNDWTSMVTMETNLPLKDVENAYLRCLMN